MAGDNSEVSKYACKCLNVRLTSSEPTGAAPTQYTRLPDYTPIFVGDDGISMVHIQATVRLPSKVVRIADTSMASRFTTLICLFCNLPIYCVHQVISSEIEGSDTLLLPTDNWQEHDILKSSTGWIGVHKDSIVGDGIISSETCSSFSQSFSLLLLNSSSSTPSSPIIQEENLIDNRNTSESPPSEYFPHLKPLFPPPPFSPADAIFARLSAVAEQESQELRAIAEQRVSDFVKAETTGLEIKEKELKRQVGVLWKNFRQHLGSVQQDLNHLRSPTRFKGEAVPTNRIAGPSSVAIRTFVPQTVSPTRVASLGSYPRVSALSQSLATSRFHLPDANQSSERPSSPILQANGSYNADNSNSSTPGSGSATLVYSVPRGEGSSVLQFKRNINDSINAQQSYKWFLNLEEEIAHKNHNQEVENRKQSDTVAQEQVADGSSSNPPTKGPTKVEEVSQRSAVKKSVKLEDENSSYSKDKGKRKVSFDSELSVKNTNVNESTSDEEDSRGLLFVLEDEPENGEAIVLETTPHNTLPLLEPASRAIRPRNVRPQSNTVLDTFSSLRPSSLPNPSNIIPAWSQSRVDSLKEKMLSPPTTPVSEGSPSTSTSEYDVADTPSHRTTTDSKAWQTFTRRQDRNERLDLRKIPEEGEGEEDEPSGSVPVNSTRPVGVKPRALESEEADVVPRSLPVDFPNRLKKREPLSLASYRPPTAMPGQSSQTSPPSSEWHETAASFRREAFLERDRMRAIDPGLFDFAVDKIEDDENEDEEEEDASSEEESEGEVIPAVTMASSTPSLGRISQVSTTPTAGERARQHALKILQARSESDVPEEGMWRSLAS